MTEQRTIRISLPDTGEEEWRAVREPLMTGLDDPGAQGRTRVSVLSAGTGAC